MGKIGANITQHFVPTPTWNQDILLRFLRRISRTYKREDTMPCISRRVHWQPVASISNQRDSSPNAGNHDECNSLLPSCASPCTSDLMCPIRSDRKRYAFERKQCSRSSTRRRGCRFARAESGSQCFRNDCCKCLQSMQGS